MYVRQFYMTVLYRSLISVKKPTRCEVLTQLASIDALWRSIGEGLRVSDNFLQGLAESNISIRTRLGHVIQKWLDMDGQGEGAPVIWNTIIDVIKGPLVQNKALAMKIYDYLKLESSVQQNTQSKCVIISLVVRII